MRRTILRSTIAVVLAIGLMLGIPLSVMAWWWVERSTDRELAQRLESAAPVLVADAEDGVVDHLDTDSLAALIPARGWMVVRYPTANEPGGSARMGETDIGRPESGPSQSRTIDLGREGRITLHVNIERQRRDQWAAVGAVTTLVLLSVLAGIVVALAISARLTRPLSDLADRASRMAGGDLRTGWTRYDIAELDQVAGAMSLANQEIAMRLEREGRIVGDVSHQLRSRLTAIQLRLDELAMHPDPDVVAEADAALSQVERLSEDLDGLIAASRESDSAATEPIPVRPVIETVVDDFSAAFTARSRRVTADVDGDGMAWTSPSRLREAVSVLLDNALRHGAGNCRVEVRDLSAETVRISVADEGPGVPDSVAPHIFRRGFSSQGSSGVGLPLARALVEADAGRLELSSRRPAVFTIVLPAAGAARPVARAVSEPR
ncbi:sensor histidine kinase [Williamsia sterculiae]|uniref:Signal transduction histidine-protein kinase/phosphatase MprB n=1 Tax=Williamsia sterculiae TaxID=1344003 RepID=A0A1N7E0D3_9NOCA|nr:HAMP domain-containing sensor histidine kinase [Williamsia sterculiae]SIR81405.1 Signal transduction histidine kinase [Williamsia sterculiae]